MVSPYNYNRQQILSRPIIRRMLLFCFSDSQRKAKLKKTTLRPPRPCGEVLFLNNTSSINLSLTMEKTLIPFFYQLLSKGFVIKAQTGCTIKEFLCRQLGIKEDYLQERIQTIFLDYKTVDDVNSAVIREGSILALSAAMPGVLGATVRKGGWYAPMRKRLSNDNDIASDTNIKGEITIKLFNLIAKELGPLFLEQGIRVNGQDFFDIVGRNENVFISGCKKAIKDGNDIDPEKLMEVEWEDKQVFLQIKSERD